MKEGSWNQGTKEGGRKDRNEGGLQKSCVRESEGNEGKQDAASRL